MFDSPVPCTSPTRPQPQDCWEEVPGTDPQQYQVSTQERPPFKLMACTKILRAYTMDKVNKSNVMIPKYLYNFLKRVFNEWDAEPSPEWYTDTDAKKLSGGDLYASQERRSSSGFGETGGGLGASRPVRGALSNSVAATA